jgi:hypothetical protein
MGTAIFAIIYSLAVLIPGIAVGVRRMHDVGKSGWYLLFPIYNLILACTEGTHGENKYGKEDRKDNFRKKKENLQAKSYQIKSNNKITNSKEELEKKEELLEKSLEMNLISEIEFESKIKNLEKEKNKSEKEARNFEEFEKNKIMLQKLYSEKLITKKELSLKTEILENIPKKNYNTIGINLINGEKAQLIKKEKTKKPSIGDIVLIKNEVTNKFNIETDSNIYQLSNGEITKIYFKRKYKIYDQTIEIKQLKEKPSKGDLIIDSSSPFENGFYKIRYNIGIETSNKVINRVYKIDYKEAIYPNHKLEIWKKINDYYSSGDLVFLKNTKVTNSKYWIELFVLINVKDGKIN